MQETYGYIKKYKVLHTTGGPVIPDDPCDLFDIFFWGSEHDIPPWIKVNVKKKESPGLFTYVYRSSSGTISAGSDVYKHFGLE